MNDHIKPDGGWWREIMVGNWADFPNEIPTTKARLEARLRQRMDEAKCTELRNVSFYDVTRDPEGGRYWVSARGEIR